MSRIRGFTLIELLVVLSLIALLIAILLPVLSSARREAATTRCLANLHQLGVGVFAYAVENRDRIPLSDPVPGYAGPLPVSPDLPTNQLFAAAPNPDDSRFTGHGLLLDGYLNVNEVANCPAPSRPDLMTMSLNALAQQNTDAWSNYVYRNRFSTTRDRVDGLGQNASGERASVLLFDFNQVELDAVGKGPDSLNHDAKTVNAFYVDGHAEGQPNGDGQFNWSVTSPDPFGALEQVIIRLDEAG